MKWKTSKQKEELDYSVLLKVLTALKNGRFDQRMPEDQTGLAGKIADTLNDIIDADSAFSDEVKRTAAAMNAGQAVHFEARSSSCADKWADAVETIDGILVEQNNVAAEIANVMNAAEQGDLKQIISLEVNGRPLSGTAQRPAKAVNSLCALLDRIVCESVRALREMNVSGQLESRVYLKDVQGSWSDLVTSLNDMAAIRMRQAQSIKEVVSAIANGDLTKRITINSSGEISELVQNINSTVDLLNAFSSEVTRVSREVGTDGRLGRRARIDNVNGAWRDLTDSMNLMVDNLTNQMRDISKVAIAVSEGDLSTKITVDAKGEILELKNAINVMVDRLGAVSTEVIHLAREVGTDGHLGGRVRIDNVGGAWRDLVESANLMVDNLTSQMRDISKVATSVAKGDLSRKITVDVRGEILELKNAINLMVDLLGSFSSEVTRVAREVGTDGKLGGQAKVEGVSGIWQSLTDNVNQLAANLTTQVRAINSVATAVGKGDLSHSVTVEAAGEVAVLKNNVNEMIASLKETTRKNQEQDWLNANLARFGRMLQGQRDLSHVCGQVLSELATLINVQHGVFYIFEKESEERTLQLIASYGFGERKHIAGHFKPGEGLLGQAVQEKKRILLTQVPANYVKIHSALGEATPLNIVIVPLMFENEVLAVMELASFNRFTDMYLDFLDQLSESIGVMVNTVHTNMRTEELLAKSQTLTEELQQQQEELTQTNEELEEKAKLLLEQKNEVEQKNREVEQAKVTLEEKAEQLATTSKYKSEFLANMSHELRTPLNSLLVLAQQLQENTDKNLTTKQVEYAGIIYDSGNELLSLINDILDLSKIESGIVTPVFENVSLKEITENMERTYRHMATDKGLGFEINTVAGLPEFLHTDRKRLTQVLKNLLSNAVKFTSTGSVKLSIDRAEANRAAELGYSPAGNDVLAFAVRDTGIGIPEDKQKIIFEAFQQADGSTSRKYGGTGLGLSISREIARILGGEITVHSVPGEGSVFTLYLPVKEARVLPNTPLAAAAPAVSQPENPSPAPPAEQNTEDVSDDPNELQAGDNAVLIVEDDVKFAEILSDMAKRKGFRSIVTLRGADALGLAHRYLPAAILLDLRLPDVDGWTILERLRADIDVRHIPVHIISAEDERVRGLQKGALTYLNKPVNNAELEKTFERIRSDRDTGVQNLLIVSSDPKELGADEVLSGLNVKVLYGRTGDDAFKQLKGQPVDCVILDSGLPDISAVQWMVELRKIPDFSEIPVIVYTREDIDQAEERKLDELAGKTVLREVKSRERLLDEVTLFLHKVVGNLPDPQKNILRRIYQSDDVLQNKRVLVVDDDMRNIFALTSVLERHGVEVLSAENGKDAIAALGTNGDIQIVLMDIMMPEMDGYETMRAIRENPAFAKLPIIALTAKAMKGDREKCIEAGASDYITKPINTAQLLSLMRVWLYQ